VIGFESEETTLRKLREQLRQISDEELIAFGKDARRFAGLRVSGTGDPHKVKLDEARAELGVGIRTASLALILALILLSGPRHDSGVLQFHLVLFPTA
jgi:hypothetical protein